MCGERIRKFRRQMPGQPSQRAFADMLQLRGLDVDKNAVQRMESGQRFITDIELLAFSKVFQVSCDELVSQAEDFPSAN